MVVPKVIYRKEPTGEVSHIISYEAAVLACYSRQCVSGGYSAEGRHSQVIASNDYSELIPLVNRACKTDFVLGPLSNNARTFDVELTNLPTTYRSSRHTRTKLENMEGRVPTNDEAISEAIVSELTANSNLSLLVSPEKVSAGHTEDSVWKVGDLRDLSSESLDMTAQEKAAILLCRIRSKFGFISNSKRTMELLVERVKENRLNMTENVEHSVIGSLPEGVQELGKLINALTSERETVAFGLPGITNKADMIHARVSHKDDKEAAQVVEAMIYDQNGVRVKPSGWRRGIAAGWVIFSIAVSILNLVFNWTGKTNFLERTLDSIAIVTFLLVSVFGLVKLTSEDEHAIRNTLLGFKLLKRPKQVIRFYDRCSKHIDRDIYQAILASEQPLPWLSEKRASYARQVPTGNMVMTGHLKVSNAWSLGMLANEVMTLDYRMSRNYMNNYTANREYSKGGDSGFLRMYTFHEYSSANDVGIA